MMRRNGLAGLLLGIALLLAQLGGATHALSHLGEHSDKERPHAACQLCVAYSAFDHASPAPHFSLGADTQAVACTEAVRPGHFHRFTPLYASRAPPRHLA